MKILLFAGAGTSVELGVPGMTGLARDFLSHAERSKVEPNIVEKLMGDSRDLEDLIENVDRIHGASGALEALERHTRESLAPVAMVRSEVEWFVQHVAERVTHSDAHLMWGPVLQCVKSHEMVFATTNYDRAIELAANIENLRLDDGFEEAHDGETGAWIGFGQTDRTVMLVKLHGSTDWYRERQTERAFRLRHPMPLFGDVTLSLDGRELGSALVLPSREKILTMRPYPWLSHEFLGAAKSCDMAIFVGSSMRDPHIQQAAEDLAGKKAVFVVNPDKDLVSLPGVIGVRETASEFLMSTLPNALARPDPVEALRTRCHGRGGDPGSRGRGRWDGILTVVKDALHKKAETARRCDAINSLVDGGVTLPERWIRRLVQQEDATLARHALGLIIGSSGEGSLVQMLADSPHMADQTFRDEYNMLLELV